MSDSRIANRVDIVQSMPDGFLRETDYRIATFEAWCNKLEGRCVGLYGTGANARHILDSEKFKSGSTIVIDDNSVGKNVCGIAAVSLDQAFAKGIDSLVIAAEYINARTVFKRIQQTCREHSVDVFDMYGNNLEQLEKKILDMLDKPLAAQLDELEACDVICINLDCLIRMRGGRTVSNCLRENSSLGSGLVTLIPYLSIQGKELVFYSSDITLCRDAALDVLEDIPLPRACTLLLSSEVHSVSAGGLFRIVYDRFPDARIVHVELLDQSGLINFLMPLVYGKEIIPADLLPSSCRPNRSNLDSATGCTEPREDNHAECRLSSCMETALPEIADGFGSVLSPTIGIVAQLAIGFTTWLVQCLSLRSNEFAEVLFTSRDGYLLKNLYDMFRETHPEIPLPASRYFYTSRKASESACAPKEGWLEKRMCYLEYISACGLRAGSSYAFVDFVGAGTCQRQLEPFAPFRLLGFYFGSRIGPALSYITEANCYFDETMQAFHSRYLMLEPYLSSPEPSLDGFSTSGTPIFAEECRPSEEIRILQSVHSGVLALATEYFTHWYGWGDVIPSSYLNALMPELDRCDTSAMTLFNDITGEKLSKNIEENKRSFVERAKKIEESSAHGGNPDALKLDATHKRLLETLKAFDALCSQHGLTYTASHGTLLGAIRNKGLIPWDDDIDVVMLREDYDKLLALSGTDAILSRYRLQTPLSDCKDFLGGYSRFLDLSEAETPSDDVSNDSVGIIHIDIMPLDNCPLDERTETKQRKAVRRWQSLIYAKTSDRDFHLFMEIDPRRISAYYILADCMSYQQLYRGLHAACTASKPTGKLAILVGNNLSKLSKECFTLDDIANSIRVPFEDGTIPIPQNAEKWLDTYYGPDWRDGRRKKDSPK